MNDALDAAAEFFNLPLEEKMPLLSDDVHAPTGSIYGLQILTCFQVINHGIPLSIMNDALDAAAEFFNLPLEEKMPLLSDDVHAPVRDKMGNYAKAVHALQMQLMEAILETLGLNFGNLQKELEEGNQFMAVNCYPACPEPDLTLSLPPHSDFGTITILLQSGPGLQLLHKKNNWLSVPVVEGALMVQVGDQMEVMSNGQYKRIVHQVLSAKNKRLSIASLHSLPLNKIIGPAEELADEKHPVSYNDFTF
ncbi:hypothetical protein PTKIN_Ptkin15bG0014300 [Pterospermum kingtungense]